MSNFILTYDLNRSRPTHGQMDSHLLALGPNFVCVRILESVWYIAGPTNSVQLREYTQRILTDNDLLIVVEASNAAWTCLLVNGDQFKATFEANQRRLAA
ncbi:hypothetical protein [Mesorhizobium sp. CAU 1732]|uniref:hypothetical protein n=1 Tax=Mesorhizobium sp. CAU 1732 TaxID=3140358 RepID=UPI0032609269